MNSSLYIIGLCVQYSREPYHCTHLQINLYYNNIGAEGAKHLADALRVSASLTQVRAFFYLLDVFSLLGWPLLYDIECFTDMCEPAPRAG